MGILDKISDSLSLATVHPEVEVMDKYIFHQVPFNVRIKLVAGNKRLKINQLEVDLIWEEVGFQDPSDNFTPAMRAMSTRGEGHQKHIIYKQKTKDPIKLKPQGSFSVDLMFNTEKAVRYRYTDQFYLRILVDVPKGPAIRDRKDIDVLPHFPVSAPLITMMDRMRFNRGHFDDSYIKNGLWNQWLLYPMEGSYSHLHKVLLTVVVAETGEMEVYLNMMMSENPYSPDMGITEEIQHSFMIHPEDLVDKDNNVLSDFLSHNIHTLLIEAEKQFYQTMVVNRGGPIDL
jgi:hypothetical protein